MRYMESVSGGGKSEIDVSTGLIRVRVVEQSLTENFGGIMGKTEIFRKGGKEDVIYMLSKMFNLQKG